MRPPPPGADARTTHPRLRVITLLLLGAQVAYYVVGYRLSLAAQGVAQAPAGLEAWKDLSWLGRWRMFTDLRKVHLDLDAEGLVVDRWEPLDLYALYPCHWPEGPGWTRDDFYKNPERLSALALDLCKRMEGPIEAVRFTEVTWPKTPGQQAQPRIQASGLGLGTIPCPR